MPIVHEYRPSASVRARAEYIGAGAMAREDQQRYFAQQAEQARQFDLDYEYRFDQAALQNQMQRSQLDQQQYQFNAGMAQDTYQFGAQNQLQWAGFDQDASQFNAQLGLQQQQLGQNAWEVEQEVQARQIGANAAIEQQRMKLAAAQQQRVEERNMSQAIRAQEQITKFPFTSQAQYDAAIQGWQQKFGMDWDFPQRAIAEQQVYDGQVRKQSFIDSWSQFTGLDANIISGMTIDTPSGPQLSVDPQVVTGMARARLDDARLRDNKTNEIEARAATDAAANNLKQLEMRQAYENESRTMLGKAYARFHSLVKEEVDALAARGEKDPATGKPFTVQTLPDDVKLRLKIQAGQENQKPVPPPGL